jgi:hypothetical protein
MRQRISASVGSEALLYGGFCCSASSNMSDFFINLFSLLLGTITFTRHCSKVQNMQDV